MTASDQRGPDVRPVTRRRALQIAGALAAAPVLAGGPRRDRRGLSADDRRHARLRAAETAPRGERAFFDADGAVRHFSDFRGRVLLVNFWATWCAPCIKEMPYLAALQDALAGRDFTVLTISQDRGGAEVAEPFMRDRLGLPSLPLFYDPKLTLGRDMGVRGLPTTFAIDKRGRAVGYLAGLADWSGSDAKALLRHLIAEDGAAPLDQA